MRSSRGFCKPLPLLLAAVATLLHAQSAPVTITTTTLPNGILNTPYNFSLTANGIPPYIWSAKGLPPGLSLNSTTGAITGVPTLTGAFPVSFTVQDSEQGQATALLTLTVTAPPLQITTPPVLPPGTAGVPYSGSIAATGGVPGYTFAIVRGSLPAGLTFSVGGSFGGTPTAFGTFGFTVQVTDSAGSTTTGSFTLVIAPPKLTLITPPPGNATLGTPLNIQFSATGGVPPYTFGESGTLPPGTQFSASGALTGTPATLGTYPFAVSVTDSTGASASQTYSITVLAPPLVITTPPTLPAGMNGSPYSATFAASGGTGGYTFSLIRGTLPPGLTLTPGGLLSGTPTTFGSFGFTVQVTDSAADTNARDFTLVIAPQKLALTTPPLGNATLGTPLNIQFSATGGVPPYTFAEYGTLPPGTQFSSSGALTGTPTTLGTYQFLVFVDDTADASANQTFSIAIVEPSLVITTATPLPSGQKASVYSTTFAATGGKPPYFWSASGLPAGLTLANTTGLLTGIPGQDGVFQVAVTVADSSPVAVLSTTKNFSLTINSTPLTFTNVPLPNGTVGAAYTALVSASGGDAPITFTGTGLPPGITLSAAGSLSGTPTTAGSYTIAINATDVNGLTAKATYTVTIAPQLVITTTSIGAATLGSSFSTTLAASGGTPPYTWGGSNLPAGLSLAQNGTLSGTPTAPGTASFSVTVTDSNGVSSTKTLSLTVGLPTGPPVTFGGIGSTAAPASQPSLTVALGTAYPANITVNLTMAVVTDSGLTDPAFQFATGGLTAQTVVPAGATGALTAVPIQLGTDAATITITAQLLVVSQDVTPIPAPKLTFRLNAAAPVITSMTATRSSTGFTVTIVGYATSRDVTTANFQFSATSGSNLGTTQLAAPVSSIFAPWYSSAASAPYGSQFTFTQPFTVTGNNSAILSVSATLTNSVGTSSAASANLQ